MSFSDSTALAEMHKHILPLASFLCMLFKVNGYFIFF